jgi:hypothetical protein
MNKTISLNARIRWPDVKDNYVVSYEGHDIGGVYRSETAWTWSITVPMALPAWSTGSAPNLQEGIKALANAWTRILKQTDPARLQRAWDLEKTALARGSAAPTEGRGQTANK